MTLIADLLDASHKKFLRPSGSCSTCPRKRIDFVPPTLKKGSIIFVIGEPGEADVENQEMLTGATGEILRKHCDEYSITDFSITSILHCRKGDKGKKKEKAIKKANEADIDEPLLVWPETEEKPEKNPDQEK